MVSKAEIAPLIAVVDDDESLRRSVARLLQASGFRSKTYDSAESLLADPHRSRFDCLIVDVQLNGMSGIGLRERLSSAGVKTPVILMTAREVREEQGPAYGSPGAAVLRKSDPGEKLLAMLRETLKGFRSEELNA
ncbi:MAG: response regulator [Albidovulum sp.]|uniref:response regulator transcription factor n=1 Tax=Albidovulum sp. TaxID=1872424 RepID=UPI003CB85A7E